MLRPHIRALSLLLLIGACLVFAKLVLTPLYIQGDYQSYLSAAQYLNGTGPLTAEATYRMLKPLPILVISGLAPLMGYLNATVVQAVAFYFALAVAMYFFAYEFFQDRYLAAYAALAVMTSYPVLKYGVDVLTESGALFFFVLSLWLTLHFTKAPSQRLLLWNALVITIGFLWKEYSIVAAIVFGLVILSHTLLTLKQKAQYVLMYAAVFLVVHVPWQWYMAAHFHYSYISWYHQGGSLGYATQYTVTNVVKALAALLGFLWVFAPNGFKKIHELDTPKKQFLTIALPVPLMSFAWGYVTSRLLYVMAPPLVIVSVLGIRDLRREYQYIILAITIAINLIWLFLSYSITL